MTELSLVRLTLDYGLEGISYTRGNTRPTLPRDRDLRPSGVGRRPQLEALLAMPNLDSYLRDALMPSLNHPELLNRVQFERTLDRLYEGLRRLIEHAAERDEDSRGGKDGTNGSDQEDGTGDGRDSGSDDRGGDGEDPGIRGPERRDLRQACEALQRERALRADVWNYLNALHQG
ncbi:hypothetical protein [Imbroritus primus]|uniref:type III secretion apparatus assembly protein SctX n=1 Tax=Imbroritus primus TaxID=3058603 RepID=UPI003D160975